MPEIIVKGVDSADAMEQLEKFLGKDAMILKTVRRDGFVEITGTNDPIHVTPTSTAQPDASAPAEPFSQILAETLKKQHARDMDTSIDRSSNPDMPAPAAPKPAQDPRQQPAAFQMPQTGYVLVGPKGAGKCILALQIASNLIDQGAARPRIVFLGNGSRANGAFLAAKCHIMGLEMIHASDADLTDNAPFNPRSDIIVVSASRADRSTQDIPGLAEFSTVLVVTAGLSAASYDRVFNTWPAISDVVISSHGTLVWTHDDLKHAATAHRRILALSDQDRILKALQSPTPQTQSTNSGEPNHAPSLFQKRWGGQNHGAKHAQTSRKITNDTGLPLLGTGSAMFNATPHQKYGAEQ